MPGAHEPTPTPSSVSAKRGCLGCLAVLLGLFVLALVLLYGWAGGFRPAALEFESSPGGRYLVVRETRTFFLDTYTKLWLTEPWQRDRSKWFALAPEVDGTWWADWTRPDELMLTDYGAFVETRDDMPVRFWRDVRIERRRPAASVVLSAPDGRHDVTIWTERDSYGQRQKVWPQSSWKEHTKLFVELVPYGAWQVRAIWRTEDHLHLDIEAEAGVRVPPVPARCGPIQVTVSEG